MWISQGVFVLKQKKLLLSKLYDLPACCPTWTKPAGVICDFSCMIPAYQTCLCPYTSRVWTRVHCLLVLMRWTVCVKVEETGGGSLKWAISPCNAQSTDGKAASNLQPHSQMVFDSEASLWWIKFVLPQRILLWTQLPSFPVIPLALLGADLELSAIMRWCLPARLSCKSISMTSTSSKTVVAAALEVCTGPSGFPRTKRWRWKNCSRLKMR